MKRYKFVGTLIVALALFAPKLLLAENFSEPPFYLTKDATGVIGNAADTLATLLIHKERDLDKIYEEITAPLPAGLNAHGFIKVFRAPESTSAREFNVYRCEGDVNGGKFMPKLTLNVAGKLSSYKNCVYYKKTQANEDLKVRPGFYLIDVRPEFSLIDSGSWISQIFPGIIQVLKDRTTVIPLAVLRFPEDHEGDYSATIWPNLQKPLEQEKVIMSDWLTGRVFKDCFRDLSDKIPKNIKSQTRSFCREHNNSLYWMDIFDKFNPETFNKMTFENMDFTYHWGGMFNNTKIWSFDVETYNLNVRGSGVPEASVLALFPGHYYISYKSHLDNVKKSVSQAVGMKSGLLNDVNRIYPAIETSAHDFDPYEEVYDSYHNSNNANSPLGANNSAASRDRKTQGFATKR